MLWENRRKGRVMGGGDDSGSLGGEEVPSSSGARHIRVRVGLAGWLSQ